MLLIISGIRVVALLQSHCNSYNLQCKSVMGYILILFKRNLTIFTATRRIFTMIFSVLNASKMLSGLRPEPCWGAYSALHVARARPPLPPLANPFSKIPPRCRSYASKFSPSVLVSDLQASNCRGWFGSLTFQTLHFSQTKLWRSSLIWISPSLVCRILFFKQIHNLTEEVYFLEICIPVWHWDNSGHTSCFGGHEAPCAPQCPTYTRRSLMPCR